MQTTLIISTIITEQRYNADECKFERRWCRCISSNRAYLVLSSP